MNNTETISQAVVIGELREQLEMARKEIDRLSGLLDAYRRREADARTLAKPLRPRTDDEWSDELRAAGFPVRDGG